MNSPRPPPPFTRRASNGRRPDRPPPARAAPSGRWPGRISARLNPRRRLTTPRRRGCNRGWLFQGRHRCGRRRIADNSRNRPAKNRHKCDRDRFGKQGLRRRQGQRPSQRHNHSDNNSGRSNPNRSDNNRNRSDSVRNDSRPRPVARHHRRPSRRKRNGR